MTLLKGIIIPAVIFAIILFILVMKSREGFESPTTNDIVRPEILASYQTFAAFYKPFLVNWENAMVTSYELQKPQPSLEQPQTLSAAPRAELNAYIAKVSQEKGVALPPLTEALPERIAQPTLSLLLTLVPTDATPYLNALTWMNTQLSTAQQGLSSMMKPVEGFIWARMKGLPQAHVQEAFATCDEIAKCMDARDQAKQASQEQELVRRLTTFQNPALQTAMKENKRLVEKSEQIQKQAQSGELLSKFSLPTAKEISVPLIAPEGGSRLSELQKSDPAKYKSLQQQGGSMFALKGLMEQINRTI
jgi:hypothetical protein